MLEFHSLLLVFLLRFSGFSVLGRVSSGFSNSEQAYSGFSVLGRALSGFSVLGRAFCEFSVLGRVLSGFSVLGRAFCELSVLGRAFSGFSVLGRSFCDLLVLGWLFSDFSILTRVWDDLSRLRRRSLALGIFFISGLPAVEFLESSFGCWNFSQISVSHYLFSAFRKITTC